MKKSGVFAGCLVAFLFSCSYHYETLQNEEMQFASPKHDCFNYNLLENIHICAISNIPDSQVIFIAFWSFFGFENLSVTLILKRSVLL